MAPAGLDRRWVMHVNFAAAQLLRIKHLNAFSNNLEKKRKLRELCTFLPGGVNPARLLYVQFR